MASEKEDDPRVIWLNWAYYRPASIAEAVAAYQELTGKGQHVLYYGGGTEILTQARLGQVCADAIIDLKTIPETLVLKRGGGQVRFGACRTLAEICETNLWPLWSQVAGRVAEHTTRCKITLGGHLAGTIPYREAALPLWLADARLSLAGPEGRREVVMSEVFDGVLHLSPGEWVVSASVNEACLDWPGASLKRTRMDWVDYPLVTITALKPRQGIRVAVSGYAAQPFRSAALDGELNGSGSAAKRARAAVAVVDQPPVDDVHGSADYRRFVLEQALTDAVLRLEGDA